MQLLRKILLNMEIKKRPVKLKCASQAEILRSNQRDDDFVKHLREKVIDLLQIVGRHTGTLPFMQADIPFKLIYFFFTSGMGNQTLGEEYTGIVQADLKAHKVPSLLARVISVILECFGEKALLKILKRLQLSINHPHSELTPAASSFLNSFITKLCNMIPIFILIHKGLFYTSGRYYSLGKRLTGIDYAKVYGRRPTDSISWGLRLLGFATLAQCALKIWQDSGNENYSEKYITFNEKTRTCQLCLERESTTTTPCGHLFCWFCIADWLNCKSHCPLCREHITSSRIVYVLNL
ncbi:peroxisomal biogenesis factor 10 [Nomia melanderi]|uniref:peroxisomal biogenesis factor 10 n=1 Tax=Nomia melanderi TaxID=2448451 RepID=UPI00130457FB|nr:peroxisome biogenesis factor 10 [Nomia melanderi]XP_031832117.1 peroxisome biogenesis factor 10 [Nomia melanderi]XP_031832118.1 peroxisome biogenesis factor 10 [Nomia melanderi]